jgi:hypothetical protein
MTNAARTISEQESQILSLKGELANDPEADSRITVSGSMAKAPTVVPNSKGRGIRFQFPMVEDRPGDRQWIEVRIREYRGCSPTLEIMGADSIIVEPQVSNVIQVRLKGSLK